MAIQCAHPSHEGPVHYREMKIAGRENLKSGHVGVSLVCLSERKRRMVVVVPTKTKTTVKIEGPLTERAPQEVNFG